MSGLSNFLNIRPLDVLDIFLLSFLFYRIILYLQGTRSMRTLFGLFLILVSYLLADYLNLNGITWIFDGFFSYFVIIIVVLFQADIRSGLARMGAGTFFMPSFGRRSDLVEIITQSCLKFSEEKTGALIVLERKIGLKNLQTGGIEINAFPSIPLIVSLFNKNVPLHDGAMIIDNRHQIRSMGAILPLSVNVGLNPELGTRHRAAIGVSEETDALVIVVSEQSGKISFAQKGVLTVIEREVMKSELSRKLDD